MANSEMYKTFLKAAHLMLPDLEEDDYRLLELASYAKDKYYNCPDVSTVVMCSIDGKCDTFRNFYYFCKKLGINTERRKVIISDGELYYSSDYSKWPTNVIVA